METASTRSTRKNGYKRPMPPGIPIGNLSIVGRPQVPGIRGTRVPTSRKISRRMSQVKGRLLIRWWEALRGPEVAKWQQKCRVDWDATDGRNGGAQRTVWEALMEMERL